MAARERMDAAETWLNAAALAACWCVAAFLLVSGCAALGRAGPIPREAAGALRAVLEPGAAGRAACLVTGVLELAAGAVFAFSAAEGSWWLARRLQ